MLKMNDNKKKNVKKVSKPFLTGAPTDEYTVKNALKFFLLLLIIAFMTFIVCSMTAFDSAVLRVGVNVLIECAVLLILFSRGADLGTDAVARGEILYQHVEKGIDPSANERKVPFHKLKGFTIGILGTLLFLILAVILALTAGRQLTGAGALPSWTEAFMRRTEFSSALSSYSQPVSISFTDIVRIIVRIAIMPFITMMGSENKDLLLLIERISPVLVLLPSVAYGIGYLQGPSRRVMVHTGIAEGNRKRVNREKRERKARKTPTHRGPQQLN